MEQWYCFRCKEETVAGTLQMSYLEQKVPIGGIRCTKCGVAYLTEDMVVDRVAKAEEMIENK